MPVTGGESTVESGQTPILIWWDYLEESEVAKQFPGWKVVIPTDGHYAAYYSQAISATAPDPAAARLWEEYLYSTTGQNLWLQGSARPIELATLVKNGTANKTALAALPKAPAGAITFPSVAQTDGRREPRVAGLGLGHRRMSLADQAQAGIFADPARWPDPALPKRRTRHAFAASVGLLPFGIYTALFLLVPAGAVAVEAFRSPSGSLDVGQHLDRHPRGLPARLRDQHRAGGDHRDHPGDIGARRGQCGPHLAGPAAPADRLDRLRASSPSSVAFPWPSSSSLPSAPPGW